MKKDLTFRLLLECPHPGPLWASPNEEESQDEESDICPICSQTVTDYQQGLFCEGSC